MKGQNIADRLRSLAAGSISVARTFTDDATGKHIARQLVRAATGGGANYEEARSAESRADFIHKLCIANKEVRETLYWLELARDTRLTTDLGLVGLISEANELVAILTSSVGTAKLRQRQAFQ